MFVRRIVHILAVCALILGFALPVAAQEVLTVVFEEYPPYEYMDGEEVKGVNMDLIREAFRRMGIKPVFNPRPWKRALYQLELGEIMALSSGFKTPEREAYAFFPSEPLAMETQVVAVLSHSTITVDSLDDLRSLTVGVIREYAYGHAFDSLRGLRKVEANTNTQLLRMLLEHRMDVILINRDVARHLLRDMGEIDLVKFIFEVASEPLYLFFSRARGQRAADLSRRFSEAVRGMREDGTFDAILARY